MSLIPWWVKAIAIGAILLVAAGVGWKTRDAFCDAAKAKAELRIERAIAADLRKQIAVFNESAKADSERADNDKTEIERLEGVARGLETRISDGACLSDADLGELRSLWPQPGR